MANPGTPKPPTRYLVKPGDSPLWASEPFRLFFPLGIAAAIFGLALWPLHYAGWWPLYPAMQHPRILIFGFGAAFIFGFLGTAWPRFLEAEALRAWEIALLAAGWSGTQILYGSGNIPAGDFAGGFTCLYFLCLLGRRLLGERRDTPPPGFALAFIAVLLGTTTLFAWAAGWGNLSPALNRFLRLTGYQGFLLLPILGVGSYLFTRFFQVPGKPPPFAKAKRRGPVVWGAAVLVLLSFVIEAWFSVRWGSGLRLVAFVFWGWGALPGIWTARAPGTRPWALRFGLVLMGSAFLCRFLWPTPTFAFEHLLFLGGFSQIMLLTGERVILGHCDDASKIPPKSKAWRWIVWLMVLTAATRASADLMPTTRVSHHIYAAITLILILGIWAALHGKRIGRISPD